MLVRTNYPYGTTSQYKYFHVLGDSSNIKPAKGASRPGAAYARRQKPEQLFRLLLSPPSPSVPATATPRTCEYLPPQKRGKFPPNSRRLKKMTWSTAGRRIMIRQGVPCPSRAPPPKKTSIKTKRQDLKLKRGTITILSCLGMRVPPGYRIAENYQPRRGAD